MHVHLWRASTQIVYIYISINYILRGLVLEFYGFAKWTFFYVSPTAFFSKVAFKKLSVTIVVFNSSVFFHLALFFSVAFPSLLCSWSLSAFET